MGRKRVAAARTLTRRQFLRVGGAGLAGAALLGTTACGGSEGGGGGELVFFTNPDTTGMMTRLVERFNERGGDVRVTLREGNSDTGQRFDQLRTQFQAGQTDIDVILGDVIWTAQLAANGWISDLSDRFSESMRSDFLPGSVEAITYDGKAYGMPWFTDTGLLYYRTDLLEESGFSEPPATWDELKEMAERVTRDANLDFGFVFQGANYEGGVCNGLEFIWGHGGDALDPDDPTRVVVDSPEAVAGLAAERAMISDGIAPQSVATYTEDESAGAFLNGNAIFHRNWPYVYSLVGEEGESELDTGQVGVSELPSGDGGPGYGTVGDQPLYISASSENQDAAWEFIRFLAEPEQQKLRAVEGSFLPTLNALYEDEEIRESVPVVPLARDALQNTRPRPISPYYSDLSLEMAEEFNDSLNGEVSPEQAAENLQNVMESIIERGGDA
ncbi:MAG: ABC transporter substrate-binding protein [Rubrobacteraceae bacterium]